MYNLILTSLITDYEASIRARLGVEIDDLSDDTINDITVIGAAELELLEILPTAGAITDPTQISYLNLGFINLAAYHAWPGLRLKLLQIESDNKSVAQRFAKSIELDPSIYQLTAYKYLGKIGTLGTEIVLNTTMFDAVKPEKDEITGDVNA